MHVYEDFLTGGGKRPIVIKEHISDWSILTNLQVLVFLLVFFTIKPTVLLITLAPGEECEGNAFRCLSVRAYNSKKLLLRLT